MIELVVQLVSFALVILIAGVKSLRFAPSELTDFELDRQVKKGEQTALYEDHLRAERPLLLAFQRLLGLVLSILLILLLASVYDFLLALLFALGWFLVIELIETRAKLRTYAEQLFERYHEYIFRAVDFVRPALQLMADRQLLQDKRVATFYSKEELLTSIEQDHRSLSKEEKLLIKQAMAYSDIKIKNVMTPRSVVVTADKTDTVGPLLLDRLHKSGQSRFPVVEKDLDHVVGMLYMHNLVPLRPKVKTVADAMDNKLFYVHEEKTLDHALNAFLRTKHHLFIVVNEFEETTGVISIEDILETIIGRKIVDEFDQYEDLRAVAKLAATKRQKEKPAQHV